MNILCHFIEGTPRFSVSAGGPGTNPPWIPRDKYMFTCVCAYVCAHVCMCVSVCVGVSHPFNNLFVSFGYVPGLLDI